MKNAMEFIKKHLLSLLCGLVAVIAVVAVYYPLSGKKQKLIDDLSSRVSSVQTLDSLRTKQRTLPIVNPSDPNAKPLDRFPNDELIKKAQPIPAAFAAQATSIAAAADKINQHELLVKNSLPTPASQLEAFSFRDNYKRAMDPKVGTLVRFLHAWHPPTPDEVTAAQADLYKRDYAPQLVFPPNAPSGTPALNQEQIQTAFEGAKGEVQARETQRIADTCWIYMDPTALTVSAAPTLTIVPNGGGNAMAPSPTEIWYAQLGLWIQQDVAEAIVRTQAGFKNVTDMPCKRLVKILIDSRPYLIPATYSAAAPTDPKAQVPKDINASPTGRECNPMYDVVHFDIVIDVEASKIPWFLNELSDRQFITVLKCDIKPIDAALDQLQGYIYGTQPVAQVHLICEEIFLRDWCRNWMPKEVASALMGVTTINGGSYSPDMGGDQMAPPPGAPGAGGGGF